MFTYNMSQLINEPTHFTENSQSLLDLIMVSDPSIIQKAYVGDCFLNQYFRYHCPTYGILRTRDSTTKCFKRNIWLFNEGNYDKYRENLSTVDWDNLFHGQDVNTHVLKNSMKRFSNMLNPAFSTKQ